MTDKECELATRLWDRGLCFFGLNDGIHTYSQLGGAIALGLAATILAYNIFQTYRAFLLLRRMNPDTRRGTLLPVLFTILEILARHPQSPFQRSWNMFVRMRMRVEHEIFDPRPEWHWPPEEGLEPEPRRFAWLRSFGGFLKARFDWHVRMSRIASHQRIEIETAGDVNDEFAAIRRYFHVLKSLPFSRTTVMSFLCQVKIQRGFLAPLHLLTGLLGEYNDKWDGIISEFEKQTRRWRDVPLLDMIDGSGRMTARDFRQLQSFIYHCWLLWGPSIPICAPVCGNWAGTYLSLQYGYGDENNSIEIVGERRALTERLRQLTFDHLERPGVMALPTVVTGILQYSSTARLDATKLPPAVAASWEGSQDARPVLFYSEGIAGDALTGERAAGEKITGSIEFDNSNDVPGAPRSHYYSAYLWIMFVVMRRDEKGEWVPLVPDTDFNPQRSHLPWNGTIPYFEHGNIADPESCAYAKQVLADKVIGAMVQLVQPWEPGTFPLAFAYCAAIDESHCGHNWEELLFSSLAGGKTIRQRIQERLENLPEGSLLNRLVDEGIMLFDHYGEGPYRHPHSACSLPFDVAQYYSAILGTERLDFAPVEDADDIPGPEVEERSARP